MDSARVNDRKLAAALAAIACGAAMGAAPIATADIGLLTTDASQHANRSASCGDCAMKPAHNFEQIAALGALQDDAALATDPAQADEPVWAANITLAGSLSEGNTESINFSVLFGATRETRKMATRFDVGYFFGSDSGDRSENRFTAGVINDWIIDESPWSIFATGRYDFDEFQSWDYRISAHGGVGYQLVDTEIHRLKLRGGAGVIKEFNSDNDSFRPEGLIGLEGSWKISERQSLTYDATIYPDLGDFGEFRTIENIAWRVLLDEEMNLSLSAGFQHEHQSQVDSGRKHNDFRLYVGLTVDF